MSHERYTGTLNIRAIEDYKRALPQMSDAQLEFLYKIATVPTKLEAQRALIMHEMGNRTAAAYIKEFGH